MNTCWLREYCGKFPLDRSSVPKSCDWLSTVKRPKSIQSSIIQFSWRKDKNTDSLRSFSFIFFFCSLRSLWCLDPGSGAGNRASFAMKASGQRAKGREHFKNLETSLVLSSGRESRWTSLKIVTTVTLKKNYLNEALSHLQSAGFHHIIVYQRLQIVNEIARRPLNVNI